MYVKQFNYLWCSRHCRTSPLDYWRRGKVSLLKNWVSHSTITIGWKYDRARSKIIKRWKQNVDEIFPSILTLPNKSYLWHWHCRYHTVHVGAETLFLFQGRWKRSKSMLNVSSRYVFSVWFCMYVLCSLFFGERSSQIEQADISFRHCQVAAVILSAIHQHWMRLQLERNVDFLMR